MMSLGGTPLYTPRGVSPYMLARRITRCAKGEPIDLPFLRAVLAPPCASEPKSASGVVAA